MCSRRAACNGRCHGDGDDSHQHGRHSEGHEHGERGHSVQPAGPEEASCHIEGYVSEHPRVAFVYSLSFRIDLISLQ